MWILIHLLLSTELSLARTSGARRNVDSNDLNYLVNQKTHAADNERNRRDDNPVKIIQPEKSAVMSKNRSFTLRVEYCLGKKFCGVEVTCTQSKNGVPVTPTPTCKTEFIEQGSSNGTSYITYKVSYNVRGVAYDIIAEPTRDCGYSSQEPTIQFSPNLNAMFDLKGTVLPLTSQKDLQKISFTYNITSDTPYPHNVHILCYTCAVKSNIKDLQEFVGEDPSYSKLENLSFAIEGVAKNESKKYKLSVNPQFDQNYTFMLWLSTNIGGNKRVRSPIVSIPVFLYLPIKVIRPGKSAYASTNRSFTLRVEYDSRYDFSEITVNCIRSWNGVAVTPPPSCGTERIESVSLFPISFVKYKLSYNVRGVAYDINAVAKKIDDSYSPESTIQFVSDLNAMFDLKGTVLPLTSQKDLQEVSFTYSVTYDTPYPHNVHILCYSCALRSNDIQVSPDANPDYGKLENLTFTFEGVSENEPRIYKFSENPQFDQNYTFILWLSTNIGGEKRPRSPVVSIPVLISSPAEVQALSKVIPTVVICVSSVVIVIAVSSVAGNILMGKFSKPNITDRDKISTRPPEENENKQVESSDYPSKPTLLVFPKLDERHNQTELASTTVPTLEFGMDEQSHKMFRK